MSNTTHKSNKTLSLKSLLKEAFLTIIIPHKTFSRIPKNPKLNYRLLIPFMFLSGFAFLALHLPVVHHTLSIIPRKEDTGVVVAVPFFSAGTWILGSLCFFYLGKFFKKQISLKRVEVAVFYLWFVWLLMPVVDLLHPLLGIPFQMKVVSGVAIHFATFFAFPVLVIEVFFLLKNLLKLTGKEAAVAPFIALSAPFINRFILDKIPYFAHQWLLSTTPN